MTALIPPNCCRAMMTAQSIVGPRNDVFDSKSLRGSWVSEVEEEGSRSRRGDSKFDECTFISVSGQSQVTSLRDSRSVSFSSSDSRGTCFEDTSGIFGAMMI